jgi:hypothetical protein
MPLITEADPPRKRRPPVSAMILVIVVLLLAGVFGWSWYQPVILEYRCHGVGFGFGRAAGFEYLTGFERCTSGSLKELPDVWPVQLPPFTPSSVYLVWWY